MTRMTRRHANQPGLLLKRYSSTNQARMAKPISGPPSGAGCSDALDPAGARPAEERVISDDRDLAGGPRPATRRKRELARRRAALRVGEFLGNPHKNISMGNSQKLGGGSLCQSGH